MSLKSVKKLPTLEEIVAAAPLDREAYARIRTDRREVQAILAGRDPRLLIVIGPCSAWPDEAVGEYARRLAPLAAELSDALKLVLRVYVQKPRTLSGWTGPFHEPDPLGPPDVAAGMLYSRRMMVGAIRAGLPIAAEALFTHDARTFLALLSWVAIGARSSEDPEHRMWASAVNVPVGLKNPTSGNLEVAVNGVASAQSSHAAVFEGHEITTSGNPFAHLVLRGGQTGPNYGGAALRDVLRHMQRHELSHPSVLVDASHDNCRVDGVRDPHRQVQVARDVLQERADDPRLARLVRGMLFESFLETGRQSLEQVDGLSNRPLMRNGLSITDPCLGWDPTRELLIELAERVRKRAQAERRALAAGTG